MERLQDSLTHLSINANNNEQCPFLTKLPAEIRIQIYEYVFHENNPIIFDLRSESSNPDPTRNLEGILLTSKLINSECRFLNYEINEVHIYAPAFSPTVSMGSERQLLISRFAKFSHWLVPKLSSNSRVLVFLGQHPQPLGKLSWMGFFRIWQGVWPILSELGKGGSKVKVQMRFPRDGEFVGFTFGIWCAEEVEKGFDREAKMVELDEKEGERLRRIKMSILRFGFGKQRGKGEERVEEKV